VIINSVRLRNFKSHSDTKIDFGPGINVILGENGAGKTSVLEAISFALFKEYGGNLENLVRRGHNELSVELVFTSHGRKYRVVRTRKKSSTDSHLFLLKGEEATSLQAGDIEVDKEISRILGIDKYLFTNAVYVRQGEIARLLIARPAEKKQLISRLLGIDVLEKVWDRMRVVIDTYKNRKSMLEVRIMEEERIKAQLGELGKQAEDVKARMKKTRGRITDTEKSLERAGREEKHLGEVEKKYASLSSMLESAKTTLERERERLGSGKKQLAEIREADMEISSIKKKLPAGWKEKLEHDISLKRERGSAIDENIGKLKGRIEEMRELKVKLLKTGKKCPLCGSKLTERHREGLLRERELKISDAEKETARLVVEKGGVTKGLGLLAARLEELGGLERTYSELKGIAGRREGTLKAAQESEKIVKDLRVKTGSLGKALKDLESKMVAYEKARERVQNLRSELAALREAGGRQEGHLHELENSRKRLEAEVKEIGAKKLEHDRLERFASLLSEIRALFDKSGLQKDLRIKSGPVIEEHMRGFFREFNFDYSDLSLDENYDVILYGPAGESTTEMMSGGERIAAALAMRLGIARTLVGGSAESMLLDEPTIYLDNQRRQDLIEVIKKLSVMPQMIVVTHDTAMEEAADKINVIRKEGGISFTEDL
jgi:exonuclease SbcC